MASSFSFDSPNQAQREAVGAVDGPVMLPADASTGKTRTVTFTNKAASEMRERIGGRGTRPCM